MTAARDWEPAYARRAEGMKASEIRELLKLLEQPGIISFAGGIPDPALFPAQAASTAYAEALASEGDAATALQYSVSEGYGPLREWIAHDMASRGVQASPENIIITAGSQQALDFLGKLLLTPGDTALVTAPTYLGALQAFSAYEPRYDTIRPDQTNRTPDSYSQAAQKAATGARVKLAYAVPDFANPTGETLSRSARTTLLDLAGNLDIPVIEDTAYHALRFEGPHIAALQAIDVALCGAVDKSRVVYLGTFSKTVAPGLRIGWICASRALVRRLVLIKQASDLNVSVINQRVMHQLVSDGRHAELIARARAHYRPKRDAMLAALKAHMPSGVNWTKPEGGFFIWLKLPTGVSGASLLKRAIDEAKVAFVPGAAFFHDGSGENSIRLSYSLPNTSEITTGVRRLTSLLR
jgi:DNA-binding transcriptional MocR family regulator